MSRPLARLLLGLLGAGLVGPHPAATAGPEEGPRLAAIAQGTDMDILLAGLQAAADGRSPAASIHTFDHRGTEEGLDAALAEARALHPLGIVVTLDAIPPEAFWKEVRRVRAPVFALTSTTPDLTANPGFVRHLAPSPADQGIVAADAMLAPLASRRCALLHERSSFGLAAAAAFARNLSPRIVLAGSVEWEGPNSIDRLVGLEADWVFAALSGPRRSALARALAASAARLRFLFSDGARSDRLLALAPEALAASVFLDAVDPEVQGREGERAALGLADRGLPGESLAYRAFEAGRRILAASDRAGSLRPSKAIDALDEEPVAGSLGRPFFEPHGAIRFFPHAFWHVRAGRLQPWPDGLLPTPGCGAPLAFREPPIAPLNERGRVGVLTYGEGETRTIEADLLAIGLSTGGAEPEMDAFCREEILRRAIRITHRLFRREADGTPIPGWSWGMSLTTGPAPEDLPRHRVWLGIVAGDHPAAGGQVIGSGIAAIYSTFLVRTMYAVRRLEPPISAADRPLLDGTYRWGEDRASNRRADEIRCLLDGFASAVGMTLAHEFGHICGCGHDTEHPTSIMNVVAGAGAAWEDAVWIPLHRKAITTTLGVEGVDR